MTLFLSSCPVNLLDFPRKDATGSGSSRPSGILPSPILPALPQLLKPRVMLAQREYLIRLAKRSSRRGYADATSLRLIRAIPAE